MNRLLVFAVLLAIACLANASPVDKSSDKRSEASVVSRLDPALRKALLQALSKYDDEASAEDDDDEATDTTTDNYETTTSELPSTENDNETTREALNDQVSSVQYHSFVVDSNNVTTQTENDSEIIRTIIVKASDKILSDNKIVQDDDESVDDNKLESKLDPTKVESFIGKDNVHQVQRSVLTSIKSNEIEAQDEVKKTTLPKIKFTTTTSTTTTTTTEAPTHNEDGENIEKVSGDDVNIYQAPLVTAFTIRQDISGQSKSVIPLINQQNIANTPPTFLPSQSLPIFEVPAVLSSTMQPPILDAQQFRSNQLQRPLIEQQQQFEPQSVYLREQESSFRNQQQFLHEQRLRIEDDFRTKQQQYENELRAFRHQQAQLEARNNIILKHQQFVQQQQFLQAPPLVQQQHQFAPQHQVFIQQLPNTQPQISFQQPAEQQQTFFQPAPQAQPQSHVAHATSIQLIPSILVGTSFPISTQQLLPSKESSDFHRSQPNLQFQSQSHQQHQLTTAQELPQRQFQQFHQQPSFNPVPAESQGRNRVFRQEIGTANFAFNQANEQQSNNQFLQSLIQNSGFNRHQTEDLNIISKVLALNHGIPDANGFVSGDSARLF